MRLRQIGLAVTTALLVGAAPSPEVPIGARIIDEGFAHSEVMATATYLADHIGGRLTNSPAMRQAEAWAKARLRGWGLSDVRAEPFDFGRGWSVEEASATMIAPRRIALRSIPVAWTPGTGGPKTAEAILAPIVRASDYAAWRGKLVGKIVLLSAPREPADETQAPFTRRSDADLAALDTFRQPVTDPAVLDRLAKAQRASFDAEAFLKAEGAVAWIRMSAHDNGLVSGEGFGFRIGHTPPLPGFEMAAEDYRRMVRLLRDGPVSLRLNSTVRYDDSDPMAYNVLADLPGTSRTNGYVMAGAHLDSWTAADGATDNGAGVAIVMEAARILSKLHVRTRRTIRFALWSGEEQGLFGSSAYVAAHLARRPPDPDPDKRLFGPYFSQTWPVTPLPGYRDMTGYFNIDNGSGKLRGIYGEGNLAAIPTLRAWLAPFASMGATTVAARPTGGSDQQVMSAIGLPAFQFIQDDLDYDARVHHTTLDSADHLRAADLRQAAVILASLLVEAANAEQPLPRRALPSAPDGYRPAS
ncbi:M20/M25/M40 family metallo-hydrolase [uncultured Sphingomonas sp.]|mgnify:CR=1 FL=1|uniref:M20/M25/M40 family metallo-hydrolase n=1 Tax=uncultured Sphingomonas sp. TaxID=158754 RepID=UPI0026274765|nr:M20/M25/M40 family metallo-hydrolase [uncultured Sphingomonas sp.]